MSINTKRGSSVKFSGKKVEDINETDKAEQVLSTNCKCDRKECIGHKSRQKKSEDELRQNDADLNKVLQIIGDEQHNYLSDLEDYVKIKSVSSDRKYAKEIKKIIEKISDDLSALKFHVEEIDLTSKKMLKPCINSAKQNGIIATHFSSAKKATILVYGYLDVHPAEQADGWLTDPFELDISEGVIVGRGVSAGKGPLLCWLHAMEAWMQHAGQLPVNMKIIAGAMHHVGSGGLKEYIRTNLDFFADVDHILIYSNSWFNDDLPVVQRSLCGNIQFGLSVQGAAKDLESGAAGGIVYEPMIELCHLMNSLVDNEHNALIPGIGLSVRSLTDEDWKLLDAAKFNEYDYKEKLNLRQLPHEISRSEILDHRWCKPSICMHGVTGAYSDKYSRCVIPGHVTGRFSIKLVPDQDVDTVRSYLKEYLASVCEKLELHCSMDLRLLDAARPVQFPTKSKELLAVTTAFEKVHGVTPIFNNNICACAPIASHLERYLGKDVILLPFSTINDRRNQANEFVSERHYMRNTMLCATVMHELAKLPVKCRCGELPDYCFHIGLADLLEQERLTDALYKPKQRHETPVSPAKRVLQHAKSKFRCPTCCWPMRKNRNKDKQTTKRTSNEEEAAKTEKTEKAEKSEKADKSVKTKKAKKAKIENT